MAGLFTSGGRLQYMNGWNTASANGIATAAIGAVAVGPVDVEALLRTDAGLMDGASTPGSLDTWIVEMPLISLAVDGKSAKGRWNGIRFSGDGQGSTRIRGGIYENEYVADETDGGRWKFSLLRYYPLYDGNWAGGWRNSGNSTLPIVPFHFTPDSVGVPIPEPTGTVPSSSATVAQLAARIQRLNDEDGVRSLQHAYGYYVDRRMWTDVVELFEPTGSMANIDRVGNFTGLSGIREAMESFMGPEGLTRGILNDHPLFDTVVEISGQEAIARGIEVGMVGDYTARTARWEFSVFRNHFVKNATDGLWRFKELNLTPLAIANHSTGWGDGGIAPWSTRGGSRKQPVLPFLDILDRASKFALMTDSESAPTSDIDLADLIRRLRRSNAHDGSENASAAYGYYLDDLRCNMLGAIHATLGHKESPFTGWYHGADRIAGQCNTNYGTEKPGVLRGSISFHWRPQPVIQVSQDGRSATMRSRLLQPTTSKDGNGGFNGAIYHDQVILENGRWKLWSVSIDEHYWTSRSWTSGWANVVRPGGVNTTASSSTSTVAAARSTSSSSATTSTVSESKTLSSSTVNSATSSASATSRPSLSQRYPPDCTVAEVGERERGISGGQGPTLNWPDIQRMWFGYKNPVSGREPQWFWPGCVPCQRKKEWALESNGYQEPSTTPLFT